MTNLRIRQILWRDGTLAFCRPALSILFSALLISAPIAGTLRAASVPGETFFTDPIQTFKLTVAGTNLAVLEKNDRSYVHGDVQIGSTLLTNVGLHLKGMGSFRPFNEKPSFSVKFDRFVPHQRYRGLTKVMLNNASQDPTYLAELMATQMFRDAGVPAARVTHAFVEVNGKSLGLYVLIEAMNHEFLRQYFTNTKGNLYEAYLQDIDQKLDQDGGKDESQNDLKHLLEICRLPDRRERWRRLPEVLDVSEYTSHLVVELFTSHSDGYANNRNNYRIYHDPTTDRFVFLAHGIDWGFADSGYSVRPRPNSIVTRAVLEPPLGRDGFRERRQQLFTNVFNLTVLSNRIDDAVHRLVAAARNTNEAREFIGYGNEMHKRIVARQRNISDQLATPELTPLKFVGTNSVPISGWRSRSETAKEVGEMSLDQTTIDGVPALHLRVTKGQAMASWRITVQLEEGLYTLEGRARTAQVSAITNKVERGNGAGLRVSGSRRHDQLIGDAGWTELHHDFEVAYGGDDKELVCELRASQGEAWFDLSSLRLRRRPTPSREP